MSGVKNRSIGSNKTPKIYQVNQKYLSEFGADMPGELDYMVPCPCCNGRAFDFSGLTQGLLRIRLKCPHCRKIVETPITSEFQTDTS